MHDSWPGGAFKEILYLDMRRLDWIGILQCEEFLEIITDTAFCKIPGSAGGDVMRRGYLAKHNQVLREIVGIIRPQSCREIICAAIRIGSACTGITVVVYVS